MEDSPVTKQERYELILDTIIQMISEGKMKNSSKLFSENQMAKKLGVSRAHVREVYSALSIFGILESRQGEGTFFKKMDGTMAYKMLFIMLFQGSVSADQIMEVRQVVEVGTAEKAAINRTETDVYELRQCIELMKGCEDKEKLSQLDNRLHSVIGRACGNPMLVGLSNIISGVVIEAIREHWNYIVFEKNSEIRRITFEQHRELVDSIINKKPYIAKVVAQEHLMFVVESLKRYRQQEKKLAEASKGVKK
ncbi:MAG: FadR family transcriptional regulator [Firmicutes bacterium]|nr:FadR family transcriptional regulator [Bacillota bacterium]